MSPHPEHPACPECGARVPEGATACTLCGLPLDAAPGDPPDDPALDLAEAAADEAPAARPAAGPSEGPFCNQCGWHNPAGARFCSQCGAALQDLGAAQAGGARRTAPPSRKPHGPRPAKAAAKAPAGGERRSMGAILAGAGGLLVVALYLLLTVAPGGVPASPGGTPSAETSLPQHDLSPETAAKAAALEEEIAGLEGAERLAKQKVLVGLLADMGRYDRAGTVQEEVALAEDAEAAWTRAGNYYYDWLMIALDAEKADWARRTVAAYQRSLEKNPGNLDVRTDMAVAYQYDPENPMEAVTQTRQVLEANPNHLQANFNMAVFLLRNNQFDQASAHIARVLENSPESDPVHQRAHELERFIESNKEGS